MELLYNKKLPQVFLQMIGDFKCFKHSKIEKIAFYFSIYKNGIPGTGKSRCRIQLSNEKADTITLTGLHVDSELAINSLLEINEKKFHLPLIDFAYPYFDDKLERALLKIKTKYPGDIYIYYSGRSFHGYHDILLSERHWREYLGELLLLNRKDISEDIIDTRWIGHSLKQGYSCLRLSNNTKAYITVPTFLCKV